MEPSQLQTHLWTRCAAQPLCSMLQQSGRRSGTNWCPVIVKLTASSHLQINYDSSPLRKENWKGRCSSSSLSLGPHYISSIDSATQMILCSPTICPGIINGCTTDATVPIYSPPECVQILQEHESAIRVIEDYTQALKLNYQAIDWRLLLKLIYKGVYRSGFPGIGAWMSQAEFGLAEK